MFENADNWYHEAKHLSITYFLYWYFNIDLSFE